MMIADYRGIMYGFWQQKQEQKQESNRKFGFFEREPKTGEQTSVNTVLSQIYLILTSEGGTGALVHLTWVLPGTLERL